MYQCAESEVKKKENKKHRVEEFAVLATKI